MSRVNMLVRPRIQDAIISIESELKVFKVTVPNHYGYRHGNEGLRYALVCFFDQFIKSTDYINIVKVETMQVGPDTGFLIYYRVFDASSPIYDKALMQQNHRLIDELAQADEQIASLEDTVDGLKASNNTHLLGWIVMLVVLLSVGAGSYAGN